MKKHICCLISFLIVYGGIAQTDLSSKIKAEIEKQISNSFELYKDLHQSPELSYMEFETAIKMAVLLKELGFEVTENVGGNGVVGVLKNGEGPVIMLRTDMDALPIKENTGLPFSSNVIVKDANGLDNPAMHACGHDMHMTMWYGTLHTLINLKESWNGTILAVAQPAEEVSGGADAMIKDGLFSRFPKPDYALAYHVSPDLPAGTIGYFPGPIFAGVSSAEITIYGVGGHGAMPHTTKDPIVLAARTILDIQTIVSREINPVYPVVVSVGSIHGGSRSNIIPEEVKMQLTIRFFKEEVYNQIKEALYRIPRGIAISAGLPEDKMPDVKISEGFTPPVANHPELVIQASVSMSNILGKDKVIQVDPATVAEDFGKYGRTPENVKIALFWAGSVSQKLYKDHVEKGTFLPALHNPAFTPDFESTYRGAVAAMSRAMIDLFNK